jgi:integrase
LFVGAYQNQKCHCEQLNFMGKYKQPFSLFKINKYWYYQSYDSTGTRTNRKSTGQKSKAKALEHVLKLIEDNKLIPTSSTKFSDLFGNYFQWDSYPWVASKLARSTKEKQAIKWRAVYRYRQLLVVHILPYFGKMDVSAITPTLINKWLLSFRDKNLSGKTGNSAKSVLSILFESAIDASLIKENSCSRVKPLASMAKKKELISKDETALFFAEKYWPNKDYHLFFITASVTGMRLGELQAVRHYDIDLEKSIIHINGSYNSNTGRNSTKNQEIRIIPCPVSLLEKIIQINDCGHNAYIFSFSGSKPLQVHGC